MNFVRSLPIFAAWTLLVGFSAPSFAGPEAEEGLTVRPSTFMETGIRTPLAKRL